MFISAGVAGVVALILQATVGWLPARAAHGFGRPESGAAVPERVRHAPPPPPPVAPSSLPAEHAAAHFHGRGPGATAEGHGAAASLGSHAPHPRQRWLIARAVWSLLAFVLMGGAIVTFLIPLIADTFPYHDITASIVACTGFASLMLFALRKTTPVKRDGFWRETLRPFLISAMMFGIGGTITGIAREWDHCDEWGMCVADEGRVALLTGLIMCSLTFIVLVLFTGWKRRPPQPFLRAAGSGHERPPGIDQVVDPQREVDALTDRVDDTPREL